MTQASNSLKLGAPPPPPRPRRPSPPLARPPPPATPGPRHPLPLRRPPHRHLPPRLPSRAAPPPPASPARVYDLTPLRRHRAGTAHGPALPFPGQSPRGLRLVPASGTLPPGAMLQSVWHYGQYGQLRKLAEARPRCAGGGLGRVPPQRPQRVHPAAGRLPPGDFPGPG